MDGQCYSVGESVQMKAPKTALPYIAKIQALWEDTKMRMSTIWYWHPDDTAIGRLPEHGVREVFIGTVADTNLVDTITGRTKVLRLSVLSYPAADAWLVAGLCSQV